MRPEKSTSWHRLALAALLLVSCVLLMAGVAWARYLTSKYDTLSYAVRQNAAVRLWCGVDEENKELIAGENTWEIQGNTKTLDFWISNGVGLDYPEDDQQVTIRLLVSSGLTNPTEAAVFLQVEEDIVKGEAVRIEENTPLYKELGAGWVYIFRNTETGEEMHWILDGGAVCVLGAQLSVQSEKLAEITLLQLQVTGDVVNS